MRFPCLSELTCVKEKEIVAPMKKVGSKLYSAIFFILILIPLVLVPFGENKLTENRPPAPPPVLVKDGSLNLSLPRETEEFFKDRFFARTEMIDAFSRLVGGLFGISANDKVILGRDGWLFFKETLGDYDGDSTLSDENMDILVHKLLEIKRNAEMRGQVFLIAVAPNKNSVYGEKMPSLYKKSDKPTNFQRLFETESLDFVDLLSPLLASEKTAYYLTDSHWNGLGARIAAREIFLAIEEKTGVKADFDWEGEGSSFSIGITTGDLGKMLYPAHPPEESDYIYEDAKQRFTPVGRYRSPDDLQITTESDGALLRVAVFRDSFANALLPYFSNAYSNVYYTRQTPLPLDNAAVLEADVIVLEIAERRLSELLQ